MIITGRFPIIQSLRSGNFWLHRKQSNGYWATSSGSFNDIPEVIAKVRTLLLSEKTSLVKSSDYFGTDMYTTKGAPLPPKVYYQEIPKVKNTTDYYIAKKEGRIAVSDYLTGQIKWTFTPGGKKMILSNGGTRTCDLRCLADVHGLYKWAFIGGHQGYALQISENLCISGALAYEFTHYSIDQSTYPQYDIPEPDWLLNQFDINGTLVTEVTGEANRKTLDILTALAEMPETLRMILNACKEVLRLYRDVKKRELRLMNKSKRIRLEYDEALRQLSKAERNSELSKRQAKLRRKQLLKDMKRQLEEIASAISSVWLTYRYGIMPNVYLVEDAFKTHENLKTVFFEFTATDTTRLTGPNSSFISFIDCKHKHFIKRKLKPGLGANLSANLGTTVWELVPLSFVVDWFITVGNFISSLQPPSASLMEEGSTYSWKVNGNAVINFDDTSSITCEPRVYKRNVIDPQLYCKLSIDPDFSPVRQYDALALIWQIALKKHFKGI